jgi:GntR family transcriptional regulator
MQPRNFRYVTIADDLRDHIDEGKLPPGAMLPSEADLSETYAASRITIRKALEALREEGLIDARKGSGWYVSKVQVQELLGVWAVERQLRSAGVDVQCALLEFELVRTKRRLRDTLQSEMALHFSRVSSVHAKPFARMDIWMPTEDAAHITREQAAEPYLVDWFASANVGDATQSLGAVAASPADAAILEVPAGSPLLRAKWLMHNKRGRPVLLSETVFSGSTTELVLHFPERGQSSTLTMIAETLLT